MERFNKGFYLYLQLLSLTIQTNITSMVTGLLTRQEDITWLERHVIIQDLAETLEMK